ncbi:MAG: DEAD/DEAH box helicase [Planctomycetes bacterium]|nr:DEAD/DEAH box helicase [Planctomycetota bacterium]
MSSTELTTSPSELADGTPASEAPVPLITRFDELSLRPEVLESVRAAGFEKPTPIQALFIPKALTGHDVMGQAKTGTGKTAAFLLPAFNRLEPGQGNPAVLILAPTRELALQIHGEIERLGKGLGFSSITLYGGSSYEPQIDALTRGVDIVVGTPGRIMDHIRSRRLDLSGVKVAVLDEADRMLDLGFRKDIEYILRHCPSNRQTLLLSATIPDDILKLAKRFMHDPEEVWTAPESLTVDKVEQFYVSVEREDKFPLLLKILDSERPSLAIVFCATKLGAKKLAGKLKNYKLNAREIHGDLVQSKREKIMGHFRTGKVQLLIATDVASRGIDVQDISHIVNYDVPYKIEDYVHRIGRTGRMEKTGKAFTFVTREEAPYLTEIEILINREIVPIKFDSLNSLFWPNPPAELPAEFLGEDRETDIGAGDYVDKEEDEGGRRKGGHSRQRGGGGRSERSRERGGHARPAQAAPPAAGSSGAAAGAEAEPQGEGSRRRRSRGRRSTGAPVEITCSACGKQTTVPFKPNPNRPVYCDACYTAMKPARQAAPSTKEQPASEQPNP